MLKISVVVGRGCFDIDDTKMASFEDMLVSISWIVADIGTKNKTGSAHYDGEIIEMQCDANL